MNEPAQATSRPLRWGMVGGGRGAFIGKVHRLAARMDGLYALTAGVLSSDAARGKDSARELLISPDRVYGDCEEMAEREAQRPDGIEVVSVVTPNASHAGICRAFLSRGIDVICEKPLATSLPEARELEGLVRRTGLVLGLAHIYASYPMVQQAREMVRGGELGEIRVIKVEFATESAARRSFLQLPERSRWKADPALAGPSGVLADIGTHAHHLAAFVTGLQPHALAADLSTFVPGARLEDDAHLRLRYPNGARGDLWVSRVAPGYSGGLRLRIFGEKGGLEWAHAHPNQLRLSLLGHPMRILERGEGYLSSGAAQAARLPAGHPEGFIEAFANFYAGVARAVSMRRAGTAWDQRSAVFPTVEDGVRGARLVEAALESQALKGVWVDTAFASHG